MNTLGDRLSRAFSIRVIFLSLFGGVCVGVLAGLVWPSATMPVVWLAALGFYALFVLNNAQMTRCDACSKRVKLGAERCHHCGYQRT